MLEDYIPLSLNVLAFILHVILLFLLFRIKARTNKKIILPLIFLMISFFSIIGSNLLDILVSQATFISYLNSFFMVSSSFFFLLAAISFYRLLVGSGRKNKTKKSR